MNNFITSNSMLLLEKSMNYGWTRQRAILDNIVNAETPGYKAKYVTFEEALDNSIRIAAQEKNNPYAAYRSAISGSSPVVRVADDETARMDGNGVNVSEQMIELTRNTYQLQYVITAITNDYARLRAAIRG